MRSTEWGSRCLRTCFKSWPQRTGAGSDSLGKPCPTSRPASTELQTISILKWKYSLCRSATPAFIMAFYGQQGGPQQLGAAQCSSPAMSLWDGSGADTRQFQVGRRDWCQETICASGCLSFMLWLPQLGWSGMVALDGFRVLLGCSLFVCCLCPVQQKCSTCTGKFLN